jgi:chorismate synthase
MSVIGRVFRVATFGESHGAAVGCVCDGIPSGFDFDVHDVQPILDRRKPGQSSITTSRTESDVVEILSGTELGKTLGTPVAMIVRNMDMRKVDYEDTQSVPRPGHADYTYQMKYGVRASSGGGRSSARETVGRVCAGALAMKYLLVSSNVRFVAFVDSVMDIKLPSDVLDSLITAPPTPDEVDTNSTLIHSGDVFLDSENKYYSSSDGLPLPSDHHRNTNSSSPRIVTRCPHGPTSARMAARISQIRASKDSCGGTIVGVITNLPIGLGEPVFDKFHAELSKAMMSIPAVKGFEIGSGFSGSECMRGSLHNDRFTASSSSDSLTTLTNHCGGVLGGITNGQPVYFRVAFKPVSSIGVCQETVNFEGEPVTLELQGRHDPCVLPRAVPIVEAMAAITVMDFVVRKQ